MKHCRESSQWSRRCLELVLILSLVGSFSSTRALAWGGFSHSLPQLPSRMLGYSTQSGLQIKVDSSWVGNRGYWPVSFQVSSAAPSNADRQITVRFSAGRRRNSPHLITVEQDFELVQGDSSASITLLVPQLAEWNSCSWEVWIDGVLDEALSQQYVSFNRTNNNASIALVMPQRLGQIVVGSVFESHVAAGRLDIAAGNSELPEKWLDLSSVDVVSATVEELEEWKLDSPARFKELLRWIRAGGNLWTVAVGGPVDLSAVAAALGIPNSQQSEGDLAPGWHYLPLDGRTTSGVDSLLELKFGDSNEESGWRQQWSGNRNNPRLESDSRNYFAARAFGMGTVTAFLDTYSSMGSNKVFEAIDNSMLGQRTSWVNRHGNNPGRGNYEFNNFLIPDVGMAPVFEFQLLMSLFVIAIGPVNYWMLRRREQLPLLLITVPAAALATTLVLFAYGLLSEGINTRVRARSFTMLDQAAGEAASWARLSYYSSFAPADGFQMPSDTAIYPILPLSRSNHRALQSRELRWGDASVKLPQWLSQGWLAARTPTQYQTITSRPTSKHIDFRKTDEGLQATNNLGVDVLALAVQDTSGELYLAENLAAESSISLAASTKAEVMLMIRTLLSSQEPQFPAGAEVRTRRGYSRKTLSQNLMETELAALTSPAIKGWGNRSYVAITSAGIEVDLGIERVIEQDSCHVIRGSW